MEQTKKFINSITANFIAKSLLEIEKHQSMEKTKKQSKLSIEAFAIDDVSR
jgi:hypothetical protein